MIEIQQEAFWGAIAVIVVMVGGLVAYATKIARVEQKVEALEKELTTVAENQKEHDEHCNGRQTKLHARIDTRASKQDLDHLGEKVDGIASAVANICGYLRGHEQEAK